MFLASTSSSLMFRIIPPVCWFWHYKLCSLASLLCVLYIVWFLVQANRLLLALNLGVLFFISFFFRSSYSVFSSSSML